MRHAPGPASAAAEMASAASIAGAKLPRDLEELPRRGVLERRAAVVGGGLRLDGQVLDLLALVDELIDDHAVLLLIQRAVASAQGHQLAVRAALDDPALFEHEDLIGFPDRREAVRDDERGASPHQGGEAVLDQCFAFTVER